MFAPANNIFKAENTDLLTGMTLVAACVEMVQNFRTEEKCCDIWDEVVTEIDAHSSRTRRNNTLLQDWVVEETTGDNEINEDEMRRLFYSTLDQVINEINVRFSHQNAKLYAAVFALQHENSNFLDVKMVQPFTDLANRRSVEAKFDVAKTYFAKLNGDEKIKPPTTKFISEHREALKAMPTVHLALKLGVTLGAFTAKCENSFYVLKTIMRDRRQSMKHAHKVHLVQLGFESD